MLAGWDHADIVAPAAGNILIFTLIDDVGAEALRGATDRLDISEVARRGAIDQEPVRPLLGHEILGKRVGEHVAVRNDMHDIGAAILLPKRNVHGADIEQENVLALGPVGELEQGVGRAIDDDEMVTALVKALQGGDCGVR